jgi:hypothetical protein
MVGRMLEATMRGFFRKRCEVDQHGVRLTELQFGGREGSAFHLHGEPYTISKPSRREFALSGSGGVYAGAAQLNGRNWTINSSAGQFDVVKPNLLGQQWDVLHGGVQVGLIRKRGAFDRTIEVAVNEQMPLPLQLFALHLVLVLLLRQQAAVAGSNAGG